MSTSVTTGFSNSIIVFLGGTLGGMVQCAAAVLTPQQAPVPVSPSDSYDFILKSIIGGFITLGIKLAGDWIIYLYKKLKDKNNGRIS